MKILIIDDDLGIQETLQVAIEFHWHDVKVLAATSGEDGLIQFHEQEPDIVLLDVSMPGTNGFDVLREIRRFSDTPVLFLSARDAETDQVRGLGLGADDYISKPFSYLALLARINAVIRRAHLPPPAHVLPDFTAHDLSVNFEARQVRLRGEVIALTTAEYKLLYNLVRNAGRVMLHQALLERIWGAESAPTANNLKALVSRLRTKIETNPDGPHYIENERGIGYRFVKPTTGRDETSTQVPRDSMSVSFVPNDGMRRDTLSE